MQETRLIQNADPGHTKRFTISQEQVCCLLKRQKKNTITPLIPNLHDERLEASPASLNVGVDYFGLFTLEIGWRNRNGGRDLFNCLTVRAVHIGFLANLDTHRCVGACFFAGRVKSSTVISNKMKNFDEWDKICRVVAA